MKKFMWGLSIVGAFLGGLVFVFGVLNANGAPQECAASGIALCFTVIPYCAARAIQEVDND